jgi:hypothetical protein
MQCDFGNEGHRILGATAFTGVSKLHFANRQLRKPLSLRGHSGI